MRVTDPPLHLTWPRRHRAPPIASTARAATSLARLWQRQGTRDAAVTCWRSVYEWFTEGSDTRDRIEAKALLAELG